MQMNQVGPGILPSVIHYAATPPDVINLDGFPAAAFLDFPLTIIP